MAARDSLLARRLYLALGALAVAALLWFGGPLVAFAGRVPLAGEPARWAAIGLALAAIAGRELAGAWRQRRRARGLLQGLLDRTVAVGPGAQEVALVQRRFERAVGLLKRSRVGGRGRWLSALRGRPFVYELPWYILIGAPGSGKTTALVNSGLKFPFSETLEHKVVRGVGGTRHCDWWFTDQAVLIDTAGRYTTHDSDRAADREAWLGFLGLLARYRPRQPINGVVLTLSATDLLDADAAQRQAHARVLCERIEELRAQLGIAFPVYMLITKCDLMAGFVEFFGDFDKDERAQVWGVTFPYEPAGGSDPVARAESGFAALEKRLAELTLDRLLGERDRERRAALYAFPQQWHLLREATHECLQAVVEGLRPELRAMLRGAYFSSATQEGHPIDRALGSLAQSLGLSVRAAPASRPSGKAFFVNRLLREVVFAEAGLAGANLRWRRRRNGWAAATAGAAALLMAVAGAWAWRADARSGAALREAQPLIAALPAQAAAARAAPETDVVALLPLLDTLARLQGQRTQKHATAARWPDGADAIAAAAGDGYAQALREAFLPRVAAALERRMRADGEHVERLYETLRAYLMLFGGRHFDAAALRAALVADWDATLPAGVAADRKEALRRHLDRLLAHGEVGAPALADPALVAAARARVAGVPLAQRAYLRLQQLDLARGAPPLSAETMAGPAARQVFVRASGRALADGVPPLYSQAVWQRALGEQIPAVLAQLDAEQAWVLGTQAAPGTRADLAVLAADLRRRYLDDYAARWAAYLDDLRLRTPADVAVGAEIAQALSRPDSPLLAVLKAVARETALESSGSDKPAPVAARFEALRQYLGGGGEALRTALGRLSAQLAQVDDAAKRRTLPPAGDAWRALRDALGPAPEPVRAMLVPFAAATQRQALAALRPVLGERMAAELGPACATAASAYPLSRTAGSEMSREAFARLLAADGLMDGFFQRHLAPYVDTGGRAVALQPFEQARALREAFFADGGRRLGTRLEFRLLALDPGISEFALDVDGQPMRFRPGGPAVQAVQWPGPAQRVQLQLTRTAGGTPARFAFDGPWALLHLLDRVRTEPGEAPGRLRLAFDVEGRQARFEVSAAGGRPNPLLRHELEAFRCPRRW